MRSDTSKHKGLRCPISRNSLSGFLLFTVQVPKNQRCVQQLVGPQVGVSTAGQMLQSREPGGRPQWGGHVLPGCAAPALPPARVRRVWERAVGAEGLSQSPARAEGGWVVFRASLKFLPLLPHEEMVSPSDDRRGADWQSFPRRCFGWSVSGTVFPCKYLHKLKACWTPLNPRLGCSMEEEEGVQLCTALCSPCLSGSFSGSLGQLRRVTACSRSLGIPQLLRNLFHATI